MYLHQANGTIIKRLGNWITSIRQPLTNITPTTRIFPREYDSLKNQVSLYHSKTHTVNLNRPSVGNTIFSQNECSSSKPYTHASWTSLKDEVKDKYDEFYTENEESKEYEFYTNASVISGTVFDKYGNITSVSAAISKTKFLADHSLHPRDLRKIDLSPVSIVPSILVRENCILVNLLHIKAIIKSDMVMVFDTINTGDASKLSLFMYDLEARLKAPGISHYGNGENWIQPYEMKALEAILINVTSTLETEIHTQLSILNSILRDLEDRVDRVKLRELLAGSKGVLAFNQKAVLIRDVMDEILESDEDLEGMRLTEMPEVKRASETALDKAQEEYDEEHFSEIEMLLDSYYKQTDEIVQQCENVISNIKSTEEIVNIILDANRNALMLLELKINVWTLGFTVGAFFAALYGMNLENYIEETDFGFGLVVGGVAFFSAVITIFNLRKLRTTRKVSMLKLEPTQTFNAPLFSRAPIKSTVVTPNKTQLEKEVPSRRDMTWKWLIDNKG